MAKNEMLKKIGLTTLLGTAIVVGTPLIYGLLAGIDQLVTVVSFDVIPNILDIGTIVSAGVSAYVADLAITQWLE